jgi:hypothetical protein
VYSAVSQSLTPAHPPILSTTWPLPSQNRLLGARRVIPVGLALTFLGCFGPSVSTVSAPFGARTLSTQVVEGGIERVASVEGITEYRLENGLKVLLFPDPTQFSVTVNVTYLVGSTHESAGETGMAHLLEHLVFEGTDRHPNIPEEISRRGGRAKGTTSFERTNYFQTMPPTEAAPVPPG